MNLKVKTDVLKHMVTKASKASINNKMIPLTGLMNIELNGGKLSITTSDAVNFFTVMENDITGDNFKVVVATDLFSKLVAKTTSETVTLDYTDNVLTYTGNGTYTIDLPLNEEGQPITYPAPTIPVDNIKTGVIKLSTIKSAILANKPALAVTLEAPYLTGYYCNVDKIISADSFNICINNATTFPESVLISPIVFDLLSISDVEDINYEFTDTVIVFTTPKMKLVSKNMVGKDDYPVEAVMAYLDNEFPSNCTLPKTAVLNVVDRLSLFISDFDVNGVYLSFTAEGVKITSTKGNASETIPYQGSENFKEFTCLAAVDTLKKQIAARTGELVNIYYGIPEGLKLVDNDITQVVALLDDSDVEE
jgi:DNA polymerase III sliding clamp (beta) subunit (PCNA family)